MPIENLKDIAAALKVDVATLQSAIASEENVSIELPQTVVFTQEEFDTREANLRADREKQKDIDRQATWRDCSICRWY